ncbi:hypothetical protein [Xylophilus sp.]|nr:hypothetical protein [Xylophilus sp.]KAF1041450.1 MAG: hypothetical protein GAK38_04575 [Xylophilus sp.]
MTALNLFALIILMVAGISADSKFLMFWAGANAMVVLYALLGVVQQ